MPVESVTGLRAGLAVFARRPAEIVRVLYSREAKPHLATLIRWAISQRIACDERTDEAIAREADATLHEGLCVFTKPRKWTTPSELAALLVRTQGTAVALDRVRNPYNTGAVIRSAAFLGIDAVILGAQAPHPALAPAAVRVAEGGTEHVVLARTTDLAETLARLKSVGVHVVGAEGDAPSNAIGHPFARPAVLVMGNEREGLSERVRAQCEAMVAIPGSGAIESLNVSIAASVLLMEMVREKCLGRPLVRAARHPVEAPGAKR